MNRCKLIAAAANVVKANEATILSPPGPAVVDVSSPDLKVCTWEVGGRTVALVVNGAYRPVCGTVRCAGHAPLEVRLGALALEPRWGTSSCKDFLNLRPIYASLWA